MSTKNRSAGSQINPRGVTQGITLVGHEDGFPVNTVVDANGKHRLCVDADVTIVDPIVNVDIDASTDNIAIRNTGNANELLIYNDGSIRIRLTDESGVAFSAANPLPVDITGGNLAIEVAASDGDTIAISGHPTQIYGQAAVSVTLPAVYTTILSFTVAAIGTTMAHFEISGPVEAIVRLKLNGTVIRLKRISTNDRNVEFRFLEPRKLSVGDVIVLEVKPDKPIPAFMGSADFFASLQGFVDT
jgi:hypothetical protein